MLLEACPGRLWWNPIDCHLGTDGRIVSKFARAFPFPPSEVLLPSSLPREFNTAPECQSHATFSLLATWSSGGSRSGASGSGTWQDAEEGLAGALALPCCSPKHRGSLLGERSTLLLTQTPQSLSGFWLNSSYYSVSGRGWFSVAVLGISVGRNVRGHSPSPVSPLPAPHTLDSSADVTSRSSSRVQSFFSISVFKELLHPVAGNICVLEQDSM